MVRSNQVLSSDPWVQHGRHQGVGLPVLSIEDLVEPGLHRFSTILGMAGHGWAMPNSKEQDGTRSILSKCLLGKLDCVSNETYLTYLMSDSEHSRLVK